jgi:hypothetical protein
MTGGVGEGFLEDPVGGVIAGVCQRTSLAQHGQRDVQSGLRLMGDEGGQ